MPSLMERIRELLGHQPTQRERRRAPRPPNDRAIMARQIAIYRRQLKAMDAQVDAQRKSHEILR